MQEYFNDKNEWIRKPSMSWIARFAKDKKPHYFDRGTLNFFNQKLFDFQVVIVNKRLFVYAPDSNALGSGQRLYTVAEVTTDGNIGSVSNPGPTPTTESQVLTLLENM